MDLDGRVLDRFAETGVVASGESVNAEMLRRARWLLGKDQTILQLSIKSGLSLREIGAVLGLPAGSVSRRLGKIHQRMQDRTVAALLDPRCALTHEYREVGLEHFLGGLTAREISDRHQMPAERVKRVISFIRGWNRGRTMTVGK